MGDETVKAIEDETEPISIKRRYDGYTFLLVVSSMLSLYLFDNYFSSATYAKNALLKVTAIVEKAPELHVKSSGKSKRHYVTFKIRGSDEIEIDRQAAFSMQEFVDEVKSGDTVIIRTPFHSVKEENNNIRLLSTFEVIGISKKSKEYIDYEIYSKKEKNNKLSWFLCALWAVFCSLYFREAQEAPQIFGKKLNFFTILIYGMMIIYFVMIFL